jgi:hypothetical protein
MQSAEQGQMFKLSAFANILLTNSVSNRGSRGYWTG